GRRDRQEAPVEVGVAELAALPTDRALLGVGLERRHGDRGYKRHVAATGEQALDLLEPDLAAADDEAAAARQPQAGDVERSLEEAGDAGLVADPLPELAHAL